MSEEASWYCPRRQRTQKEAAVICITLFPASTFLGNKKKKKVIFILTCLEFSKVNGWLALLYANVTGVATQGPGGREGLPHKGRV